MYSPVFFRHYRNPPIRSTTWSNLWFAGNYRTFPSIVSTGTALGSGVETGAAMAPDEFQNLLRADYDAAGVLVKASGARIE